MLGRLANIRIADDISFYLLNGSIDHGAETKP